MADADTSEPPADPTARAFLARLDAIIRDCMSGQALWHADPLKHELTDLVTEIEDRLSPAARPIHRARLSWVRAQIPPPRRPDAIHLGAGVGRDTPWPPPPPRGDAPHGDARLTALAKTLAALVRELPFRPPDPPAPEPPAPDPAPPDSRRAAIQHLYAVTRRVERDRHVATLRRLRDARAQLEDRDREGFEPNELALVTSLSERLLKSWPFRAAFGAFLLAAVFAILGTIKIGDKEFDFARYVDQSTRDVAERIDKFDKSSEDLRKQIVERVVATMTARLAQREGELQAAIDAYRKTVDADGKTLETLDRDIARLNGIVAANTPALDGIAATAGRLTANETSAGQSVVAIGTAKQQAAVDAALIETARTRATAATDTILDKNRTAAALAGRIAGAERTLQGLVPKIAALEADANTARPDLNRLAHAGEAASQAIHDAAAADAARRKAEEDAAELAKLRTETPRPQPGTAPEPRPDPRVDAMLARLAAVEINLPVDLSFLGHDDCARVQGVLIELGTLLPDKRRGKPPADGQCGRGTNAAAEAWQRRVRRSLGGVRSADGIIAILREPPPAR